MAGIKGRSGRKSNYQLIQDGNLLEVCTKWLVSNFDTFDKETKIRVALEIAKKGIKQQVEHSGDISLNLAEKLDDARNRRLDAFTQGV